MILKKPACDTQLPGTHVKEDDLFDRPELLTLCAQVIAVLIQHQGIFLRPQIKTKGAMAEAEAARWPEGECLRPYLKVAGMEHVSNDDNFLVPLPRFSLLLRPPVQLSAQTKTRTSRHNDQGVFIQRMREKCPASQIHIWVISTCDGSPMQSGNICS